MWIPYNHEDKAEFPLPKTGELVWINDEYYAGVTVGFWDGYWHNYAGSDDVGVTHWMPLVVPNGPGFDDDTVPPPDEPNELNTP